MLNPMRILFYRSGKRENQDGLAPIYCRVTRKGNRPEFSTGLFCKTGEWDRTRKVFHDDEIGNTRLASIHNSLRFIWLEHETKGKILTPAMLIKLFKGQSPTEPPPSPNGISIIKLYDDYLEESFKAKPRRKSTREAYEVRKKCFITFIKSINHESLFISQLTKSIGKQFISWLSEKDFSSEFRQKVFNQLKQLCRYALEEEYITADPTVFLSVKREKRPKPISLKWPVVFQIMNYRFASQRIQEVADLFILECYTGVSYIDLYSLSKECIAPYEGSDWFYIPRTKTGSEAIIPVLQVTMRIMEKYNWRIPQISNAKYNSYLKEVSEILGLELKLTTHMARRTFAQLMLNNGCSAESVSRMLGHDDLRSIFENYATIGIERISTEKQIIMEFGKAA